MIRRNLPRSPNKLEGKQTGCANILQLSPSAHKQGFGAQATKTGSFQGTPATFTIPTNPSVANLLILGSVKDGDQVLLDDSSHYFCLHELSDVTALKHHLKGEKPNLKPRKERGTGQLPEPYLAVGPECNSSMSILEKHIKGVALFESHVWPWAPE